MLRTLIRCCSPKREQGQALVLFAGGLVIFLGFVAMSIDVGRFVWARTQMQAAVDAAALAAAQSMPDQADAAVKANDYWQDNSGFIRSQGSNVQFNVSYPPGNKRIMIRGDADIPTWFAKFFGISSWHVSAEGDAESQVLDIAVVLDISGSMCWGSYPPTARQASWPQFGDYTGPGRVADQVKLTVAIPASTTSPYTITVNNTAIFNSTSSAQNNAKFGYNTTTRYFQYNPGTPDSAGIIKIDNEIFRIQSILSPTQMSVTRGLADTFKGTSGMSAHPANALVQSHHADCLLSAPSSSGPYDYYDGMITDAQYFTTLFNPTYDKIGLASFSSSGTLRRNLTGNFSQVQSDMAAINNPNGGTNSAHGMAVGRQILDGSGKRANAVRVLVFLTDGRANSYCGQTYNPTNYNTTSCPSQGSNIDGNSYAVTAAFGETSRAANEQIIIFTIGFGPFVDDSFLMRMADGGVAGVGPCQNGQLGCRYYKAPTLAQLDSAFQAIAAQTHIALVR